MKKIGFIGYGLRSETMMRAFRGIAAPIEVAAIADPAWQTIQPKLQQDSLFSHTRFYADAEEMLAQEKLDGIFIGTRCNLHSKLAAPVIRQGTPVFLEKPICISPDQYKLLLDTPKQMWDRVTVSFPLRYTIIVQQMKHLVESGVLGDIVTVQAINNVPYGNVYYHSWYRDSSLTGGLFLQKATHDLDYICYVLGKHPASVTAVTSKMYFRGDKPAGSRCEDCADAHTCKESSFYVKNYLKEEPSGEFCCFAQDTGNEDVGAALFTCPDGTIISYHQTFLVKNQAGRRGARFIGTKASAEFDFYTAELRVDYYDSKHTAVHKFTYPEGLAHFGGDEELAKAFLSVMEGNPSGSDLAQGMYSAAACLAAKASAESHQPVAIDYGF